MSPVEFANFGVQLSSGTDDSAIKTKTLTLGELNELESLGQSGVSIVAVAACFSAQAASNGVTVSIAPEKSSLNKEDDVVVRVTITNTSSTPQYILKWHTPFGGIEEALFEVTRDGVDVPYLGAHYKRPAPTAKRLLPAQAGRLAHRQGGTVGHVRHERHRRLLGHATTPPRCNCSPAARRQRAKAGARGVDEIESAPAAMWINGRLERGTVVGAPFELPEGAGGTRARAGLASPTAPRRSRRPSRRRSAPPRP